MRKLPHRVGQCAEATCLTDWNIGLFVMSCPRLASPGPWSHSVRRSPGIRGAMPGETTSDALAKFRLLGQSIVRRRNDNYCINQPWLTTSDWPVSALVSKAAKNNAA